MSGLHIISLIIIIFLIIGKVIEILFLKKRALEIPFKYSIGVIIFINSVYLAYYEGDFLTSIWIILMYLLFDYLINY